MDENLQTEGVTTAEPVDDIWSRESKRGLDDLEGSEKLHNWPFLSNT